MSRWWGEGMTVRGESGHHNFSRTTKCVSEWNGAYPNFQAHTHTWPNDANHPNTHAQHEWLTDSLSDKRNAYDWSLDNCNDSCVIVYMTPCESAIDVYIANMACEDEVKTLCMITTWSQAWHWHQHAKFVSRTIKKGGCEYSHELTGWTQFRAFIK